MCLIKDHFHGSKERAERLVGIARRNSEYSSCDDRTLVSFGHQILEIADYGQPVSDIINFNTYFGD